MAAKSSKPEDKTKPLKPKIEAGSSVEGANAPQFELPDQSGAKVSLKDLLGKKNLVLYFYPKDMTPGCTTEACSFRDNIEGIRRLGAQVVGISGDSSASHQKFIDKHALNFPLLADVRNEVGKRFGVYKMKSMYGREYMATSAPRWLSTRAASFGRFSPRLKSTGTPPKSSQR
jgi:thioredoxin-dependent peroxiredoxin